MDNQQNKGRNGDSMLVHMNPSEVGGLAALAEMHGRSMTINPDTGYPEAFSLGDILPSLVGLGASAFMPAASPWVIGGLTGATTAATTGSLEKGLLSGLTAGGLSSLGNSLSNLGAGPAVDPTNVAQSGGLEAIMSAKPPVPYEGIGNTAVAAGQQALPTATQTPGMFGQAMDTMGDKMSNMGQGIGKLFDETGQFGTFMSQNKPAIMGTAAGAMGTMAIADEERRRAAMDAEKEGKRRQGQKDYMGAVNQMGQSYAKYGREMPMAGLTSSKNYNPSMRTFAAGGMAESEMNQVNQDIAMSYANAGRDVPQRLQQYMPSQNVTVPTPRQAFGGMPGGLGMGNMSTSANPSFPSMMPGAHNAPNGAQTNPFGGIMGLNRGNVGYQGLEGLQGRNEGFTPSNPYQRVQGVDMGTPRQMVGNTDQILNNMQNPGAQGMPQIGDTDQILQGMNQQQNMASGGQVAGPGDGMSDDIMTSIDNQDPAALSDGEFVIPADVVSHLGNGSSDAGARRLYEMMDKIRQMRTGDEQQAKQVNPDAAMPI